MDIHYRTNRLRDCATDESVASRAFGRRTGAKFFQIVNLLAEQPSLQQIRQIKSLNFHQLGADRTGEYAITLGRRERLIVTLDGERSLWIEEVSLRHYE